MILFLVVVALTSLTAAQLWCLRAADRRQALLRMAAAAVALSLLFRLLAAFILPGLDSFVQTMLTAASVIAAVGGISVAALLRRWPRFASGGRTVLLVIVNVFLLNVVIGTALLLLYGHGVSRAYGG